MNDTPVVFQLINVRSASDHEYHCLCEFKNLLNREYMPDDPPIPAQELIQGWKNLPGFVENRFYAGWNAPGTELLALCEIAVEHVDHNKHLAFFHLEVHPEYRCRGLGRKMLGMLLPFAKEHGRTLLMTRTSDRIPAAALFLERMGAHKGLESHTNQLKTAEFDHGLLERWLKSTAKLGNAFEVGLWDGPVPEDYIVEITALVEKLGNDQPRDQLQIEDMKFTPEILREFETYMFEKGEKRWILYSIDKANRRIVGLTEVFWHPNRPDILNQGFTAVFPEYRNQGLGRWLKATMMKKILEERPEVQLIRTGNANSNAPMLKINNEMGFKPYIANTLWQVETARVERYLAQRETAWR